MYKVTFKSEEKKGFDRLFLEEEHAMCYLLIMEEIYLVRGEVINV